MTNFLAKQEWPYTPFNKKFYRQRQLKRYLWNSKILRQDLHNLGKMEKPT